MDTSYLENKILNLQARLKAGKESSQRENYIRSMPPNVLSSPLHNSGRRPKQLGDMGTPVRTRKQLDLPVNVLAQPRLQENSEVDNKMKEIMKMNGILNVNGKQYYTDIKDLEHLGELGNGTCGQVVRMLHKPSQTVIAVKQMRRSGNSDENKRIIMDLDVVFKSLDCPYIVSYLGCFITESDVWICMELMATCFDRLLKRLRAAIPEDILGKVTLATVKALHYLKECHGVIHRDVKPSNILLDEKGNVKLCDFGISGRLVDSKAKTKNAGCAAYMAPERIEPPDPRKPDYDIRADVWSLGITLVELATGVFPYKDCKCDFEVLSRVLNEDPPCLPSDPTRFTPEFQNFVSSCLTKDYSGRPKYRKLLEHPFLKRYETKPVDVAEWYAKAISNSLNATPLRYTPTSLSTFTRRQPPPPPPPTLNHQNYQQNFDEGNVMLNGDGAGKHSPSSFKVTNVYKINGGIPSRWDHNNYNGNSYGDYSPLLPRRRHLTDTTPAMSVESNSHIYSNNSDSSKSSNNNSSSNIIINNNDNSHRNSGFRSENSSPLVLQRFYHQQMNQQHYYRSYPHHNRSSSLSPSRRYITENTKIPQLDICDQDTSTVDGPKKRYSSYLKFHLGVSSTDDNRTIPRPPSRHHSPSPAPPSPPPRLSRLLSADSATNSNNINSSHALTTYKVAYNSCNRDTQQSPSSSMCRLYEEYSPLMSRRYVSPCPPQPPPRRLSESSSVPGSPQHLCFRRNDLIRNSANNKYQYTPQPQRKAVYQINDL